MMVNHIKPARQIITGGLISPAYTGAKAGPYFYGATMVALATKSGTANTAAAQYIRNITNNLRFYNQVAVRIALNHGINAYGRRTSFNGHVPDVRAFAADLIDGALRQELDRETAVMARGENVAANQRRQRALGKYLLSKPYRIIRNFYGVRMQNLAAAAPPGVSRENTVFHSDIIHERTDKTVYAQKETQIERATATPVYTAAISDGDLNRIAEQAAKQVERKIRTERERIGKW